jgi:hypothetical protein
MGRRVVVVGEVRKRVVLGRARERRKSCILAVVLRLVLVLVGLVRFG